MDIILLLKAAILGVVEGLTEFLPISSTGHLILVGDLLNFNDERGKVFEIVIQFAAILAVCWEYRAKLTAVATGLVRKEEAAQRFTFNLFIAFLPLAILGLLFGKAIKANLFSPVPVALAFIVGGLIILWAEKRKHSEHIVSVDDMDWKDALKLGFAQALALIPGTSRSGATIIGGLFLGLSRKAAAEFSFFLAIPTLGAATVYEVIKYRDQFHADDLGIFLVGSIASFVSAFLCVRWLLRYISRHDFTIFAWYRIAFGLIVLITAYTGVVSWSDA
ncbi:MAG TPA: undecaprenyl-diphosphate phosphatase [Sideroxyarcus sp.]|nr:undecaprenyl-diphosphate phosphatase [Sideroxyarcus sp.]